MNEVVEQDAVCVEIDGPQPSEIVNASKEPAAVYAFDGWGMIPLAPQAD